MSIDVTTSTPTKRRQAPPPIRNLRLPNLKLPPGACDTHFHFPGPQREFPFNPNRHFVPDVDHDDSTIADWKQMQSALGLSRGLVTARSLAATDDVALGSQRSYVVYSERDKRHESLS